MNRGTKKVYELLIDTIIPRILVWLHFRPAGFHVEVEILLFFLHVCLINILALVIGSKMMTADLRQSTRSATWLF